MAVHAKKNLDAENAWTKGDIEKLLLGLDLYGRRTVVLAVYFQGEKKYN